MAKRPKLTDALCKSLPIPAKGPKLYRCGETTGFGLQVTAAGHRAFVFCYYGPNRRERRMTIGQFPSPWSLKAARDEAAALRRLVDRGIDPLDDRIAQREAMTLGDLWEWYREGDLKRLSSAWQQIAKFIWDERILPALKARTKLEDIRPHDIQRMIANITDQSGATTANRAHSLVRRAMNLAMHGGWIERNPAAQGIKRNAEHARERFLSIEEARRLLDTLEKVPGRYQPSARAIKLLLLTGARRSEVLGLRYGELDLERCQWIKPASRTKQRRVHRVNLSDDAVSLLKDMRGEAEEAFARELEGVAHTSRPRFADRYVFPGSGASGHIKGIKRLWAAVCKEAGLENVRIHDLRHSFASFVASSGGSLPMIGAMLGHSQAQTTARYAHFFDDDLRVRANSVGLALGLDGTGRARRDDDRFADGAAGTK